MRRGSAALSPGILLAGLLAATALLPGCSWKTARKIAAGASKSRVLEETTGDPLAFSTIRSVAVIPFVDRAPQRGFDAKVFATRLANQIALRGEVRVVYPGEILAEAEKANEAILRHNATLRRRRMLGITPSEDRETRVLRARASLREVVAAEEDVRMREVDPVHHLDDALKIARKLGADAVIVGMVTDYDPYMRPRIALNARLVATGTTDAAAMQLATMTQWGVPRGGTVARGLIWQMQKNFDSSVGSVATDASLHALTRHTEHHPYDIEAVLRSMSLYYNYVGSCIADELLTARKQAASEVERRALAQARERRESAEATRAEIRRLTDPHADLPEAEEVIARNLPDRRERSWRPDVYNRGHPEKAAALYAPDQLGIR